MLIAGLTELILIAAVSFAARRAPKPVGSLLQTGYVIALCCIGVAAFVGGLRFLELANTHSYHIALTYVAKQVATPVFVLCALWPHLTSPTARLTAKLLMLLAVVSCLLNLRFELAWLADAIIVTVLVFAAFQVKGMHRASFGVLLGLMLLLSNLLWQAMIDNESLRIGIAHVCLAGFFMVVAKSMQ